MPACQTYIVMPLLLLLICSKGVMAQQAWNSSKLKVQPEFLYFRDTEPLLDLYINPAVASKDSIRMQCYYYPAGRDSTLVYWHEGLQQIKAGPQRLTLSFRQVKGNAYILPSFAAVIKKAGLVPPGTYRTFVTIKGKDLQHTGVYLHETDSVLSIQSSLRKNINNILVPQQHSLLPKVTATGPSVNTTTALLDRSEKKLDRYFKKNGLQPERSNREGKEIIELYAEGWYLGRYELQPKVSLRAQLQAERNQLQHNAGSLTGNSLGSYSSLSAQFREMKKESRENKELIAEIALSTNYSSGQEPGSQQDNNFQEARGMLEFPLFDIPVSLEGYYTTQDRHRQSKASYVHFRYDAEKAKQQLLKLVGSYNKRYEQTISQGRSYDMVYSQFITQLKAQKDQAAYSLRQQLPAVGTDFSSLNEEQLKVLAMQKAEAEQQQLQDSLQQAGTGTATAAQLKEKLEKAQEARRKATATYEKAQETYRTIRALEQKIGKYEMLLQQYSNTSYYDSIMAYGKLKALGNTEDLSYKDLAKKASGLLPESKTKNALTGLTSFDAGMFPKYVSDYTLSGQTLKGLDAGYDIGFAAIGGSYGRTEYIGRDGQVESYKAYSGRVQFKPVLWQRFGFVYFGYSPSRSLLNDKGFFKDVSASMPSFRNPVHILSATYSGAVSRFLLLSGEYATSVKPAQSEEARSSVSAMDRSAYNIKAEGDIPATTLHIEAGFEHAGRAFENNTLPMILAGTDRFRIKGKGDFLRNFLTLGIEYNYMLQNSFYSKGSNSRWGFDIATHSKRYPSIFLSYKPFSTFRSYNDTLQIAQKLLLGEVWTGKTSYQIKKQGRALRFTFLYNRNTSTMDTVHYQSALLQFNTIYTINTTMLSLNVGSTDIQTDNGPETAYPVFNSTRFVNASASGMLTTSLLLSGGTDIATAQQGICRYGLFLGSSYTFKVLPLTLRASFRYSNYRMDDITGWKQLYSGGIELAWRFKVPLFDD